MRGDSLMKTRGQTTDTTVARVGLASLVLLLFFLPAANATAAHNITSGLALLLLLAGAIRSATRPPVPLAQWWAVYAAVAMLSLIWSFDRTLSLRALQSDLLLTLVAVAAVAWWVRTDLDRGIVLAVLLAGFAVVTIAGLVAGLPTWTGNWQDLATPFDLGVGRLSTYIVLMAPLPVALLLLAKSHWQKALLTVLVTGSVVLLALTSSRAGPLALGAGLFTLLLCMLRLTLPPRVRRSLLIGALLMIIASAVVTGAALVQRASEVNASVSGSLKSDSRIAIWGRAAEGIAHAPLTGTGYGQRIWPQLNTDLLERHPLASHAHNVFLNKAVQMGLPGLVSFAALLLAAIAALLRELHRAPDMTGRALASAALAMTAAMVMRNMTDDFWERSQAALYWAIVTLALVRPQSAPSSQAGERPPG